MIIQGSNNPLVIQFDADVSNIPTLIVTLWCDLPGWEGRPVKKWTKDDMTISGETVTCPLTQNETRMYGAPYLVLEAKGLNENGGTVFWDEYKLDVKHRRDKIIQLSQMG